MHQEFAVSALRKRIQAEIDRLSAEIHDETFRSTDSLHYANGALNSLLDRKSVV